MGGEEPSVNGDRLPVLAVRLGVIRPFDSAPHHLGRAMLGSA